jgi:hypothetical protein
VLIFGSKREEDGSWRRLHSDELDSLCSSHNIVRMIKSRWMRRQDMWHAWGRGVVFDRVMVGKRPLGRPRHRWGDYIKVDNRKIAIDGANWIRLTQDRLQWRLVLHVE